MKPIQYQMFFPWLLQWDSLNYEILMLVQPKWRTLRPCKRPGVSFQTKKTWLKNKRTVPQHNTTVGDAGLRVMSGAGVFFFLSWWPCCLFCASGIKGRHCWNEKQMLVRNSPDCSSFFHAWASNAASVHRFPSYFLSLSLSLLCKLFTFSFFLSSFQL